MKKEDDDNVVFKGLAHKLLANVCEPNYDII